MVIFINGSINSGKSTVSKILAEKLEHAAVLEIDSLRQFISHMPLETAVPINLEGACLLIKNFISHGLTVIVPYPLSQKNYDFIKNQLADIDDRLFFFTLTPPLQVLLKNRGGRIITEEEMNRIRYHYSIGLQSPQFGITIDNENQTPEETADTIIRHIPGLKN